jgi:hypothetical protein
MDQGMAVGDMLDDGLAGIKLFGDLASMLSGGGGGGSMLGSMFLKTKK